MGILKNPVKYEADTSLHFCNLKIKIKICYPNQALIN